MHIKIYSEKKFSVLIFDSGFGGFSIYEKIRNSLPNIHYIYAFDNVAFPYGERSEEFIITRLLKIISAVKRYYPLALAVIACNTASTVSLSTLREKFNFPIVGVVPAIKPAAYLTTNGTIGLLATNVTVKCSYTKELINKFANGCQIKILDSSELVKLAEAKLRGKKILLESLIRVLRPWLQMLKPPDTVVLGCTHFSSLKDELLAILPKGTVLVDSSSAVANLTIRLIKQQISEMEFSKTNIAYCMALNLDESIFLPTLHRYGFKIIKELKI